MKTVVRNALFTAAFVFSSFSAAHAADSYKFDPNHTSVIWRASHFGHSSPHGIFSNIEGDLTLDEKNPEASSMKVTVPVAKLATGIAKFDEHLKSKDFFNAEKFPTATFVSTKVEKTGDKTAKVTGDLTLLGVTKPVTLDVTLNQIAPNPMNKKQTAGFTATGTIKRSDFGMNFGVPNVSDEIPLTIEAEANKVE
jgi:polyisoprenoid-binding protein YceI